jgi:hypothetical protein
MLSLDSNNSPKADAAGARPMTIWCSGDVANDLYDRTIGRLANGRVWEDVHDVAVFMQKNFMGSIPKSAAISHHLTNPELGDKMRDFLADTILFIRTGKREYSINTWMTLLTTPSTVGVAATASPSRNGRIPEDKLALVVKKYNSHINYVAEWLRQENGFEDMLMSMKIMYGDNYPYDY